MVKDVKKQNTHTVVVYVWIYVVWKYVSILHIYAIHLQRKEAMTERIVLLIIKLLPWMQAVNW